MKRKIVFITIFIFVIGAVIAFFIYPKETMNIDALEVSNMSIKLPEPKMKGAMSVEESLAKRRSVRSFSPEPISLSQLSQLLWAAQGITNRNGFRTAPSAGALYPLDIFIAAGSINGIKPGIYKYIPEEHVLKQLSSGDRRDDLYKASLYQEPVRNGAAVIVVTAEYERITGKYRERGIRYAHIEVGHAVQNIYLQAVSLDLGTVIIGAFHDEEIQKAMNIKSRYRPICVMPVGRQP
jgi:SagB-type dehydrogenase family enzyme